VSGLRAEFPVLERVAFLNAGSDGPVPRRAAAAVGEALRRETEEGRAGKAFFDDVMAARAELRRRAAALMSCDPLEVALTHSTTDGVNIVLRGLRLERGDEVVTTDEEHPGVLAPLAALAAERGVRVRFARFAQVAEAVSSSTRLVACSHVSWVTGQVVDATALAATGVPILLDGAQGLGAIPVDPGALGCTWYAAAGQKWLCGPDRSGFLYVRADAVDALGAPWPSYISLSDASRAEELPLAEGATRFDMGFPSLHEGAWSLAAFETFERAGWGEVLTSGPKLAQQLATALTDGGTTVAPRGDSTLVAWHDPDPEAFVERAAAAGVVLRHLPGRGLVRASVGAWNNEADLDRLLALEAGS
jgi:selenocysteine lyase/cysteine desulfurase